MVVSISMSKSSIVYDEGMSEVLGDEGVSDVDKKFDSKIETKGELYFFFTTFEVF